jgi:hypothetical protein
VTPEPARRENEPPGRPAAARADEAWVAEFGRRWRFELALLLGACVAFGAFRPLGDPDLPLHLATGEWIARHGAVPIREPFAWTMPGAPYYAISWLPQLVFYVALAAGGQIGLRVVSGVLVGAAAAAAFVLGRVARWSPGVTLTFAALNVCAAGVVTAGLRPQVLMFTYVPLAWAATIAFARAERPWRPGAALFAVSALAVNSHLFFPLVLAPLPIVWASTATGWRRAAGAAACAATGWAVTPYLAHWFDQVWYYVRPYPLFQPPSPIAELTPGFASLAGAAPPVLWIMVLALLAFPWIAARARSNAPTSALGASYWVVGLLGFGYAARLLAVWWLVVFPLLGTAVQQLLAPPGEPRRVRPGFRVLLHASAALVAGAAALRALPDLRADVSVRSRHLPTFTASAVRPLADWLAARTASDAGGRIFTTFDYGSYLTWRLPRYSSSADSRGTFPPAMSASHLFRRGFDPEAPLGPWRDADLALVPMRSRFATALDTASGWKLAAVARAGSPWPDTAGLWVRQAWWARHAGARVVAPVFLERADAPRGGRVP